MRHKPAHTVRRGAIAANIWLRQSQTGFVYYDYSISRSWKSENSGREGYSSNFFPKNAEQIAEVIVDASAWIESTMENAETVTVDAS